MIDTATNWISALEKRLHEEILQHEITHRRLIVALETIVELAKCIKQMQLQIWELEGKNDRRAGRDD